MRTFYWIFIIALLSLSWCSVDWNWEKDKKITELSSQLDSLKNELHEADIQADKLEFEKQKYEEEKVKKEMIEEQEKSKEQAKEECLIQAHERFVKEGWNLCFDLWYTQYDIDNLKCKLSTSQLKRLEDKQTEAMDFCLKAYK